MIKRILAFLTAAALLCACAAADGAGPDYVPLLAAMLRAYRQPSDGALAQIEAAAEATGDDLAPGIAAQWEATWLNKDYRLLLYGKDDPAALPVFGKHAFVVLGFQLCGGEMTDELRGRCDAAAAAARAFPGSILVCTGGATGENNPERRTEAGLMKEYLSREKGVAPERVFTDEEAMTTAENARNTLAILREQGVETMTIVTSDYHQLRGQTLYAAMAARCAREQGYSVELTGNYCFRAKADPEETQYEYLYALYQLCQILELPREQVDALLDLF